MKNIDLKNTVISVSAGHRPVFAIGRQLIRGNDILELAHGFDEYEGLIGWHCNALNRNPLASTLNVI